MFFSTDPNQQGTFRFKLFGFPISIHWSFLILPILWGSQSGPDAIDQTRSVLIYIIGFFISIVGHELGHALAYRSFGGSAQIMIHAMGGMAVSHGSFNRKQKIIITAAGPLFGLAMGIICLLLPMFLDLGSMSKYLIKFLNLMIFLNIFWSFFNLLPIIPLDGGQLLGHIMHEKKPVLRGQIGGITAGLAALFLFLILGSIFGAILLGYLAYQNFKAADRARRGYW
ncbi:MAG: metalloprotease [Verrucomicrobiales bacterium]|jgi:stage IV sporulation protein FB|tara:strand:- start:616 stop:1293 length:678 start_codon:yes stop_codon:yes gene_type:complete